jgi:hypothetical protein
MTAEPTNQHIANRLEEIAGALRVELFLLDLASERQRRLSEQLRQLMIRVYELPLTSPKARALIEQGESLRAELERARLDKRA